MKLIIPVWTHHHNQILYSSLYFAEKTGVKLEIAHSSAIRDKGAILAIDDKKCLLDYSDHTIFIDKPEKYDCYFKRSLDPKDESRYANVYPLNFQVNISYKPFQLALQMPVNVFNRKDSWIELIRALDYWSLLTNDSHHCKHLNIFNTPPIDNNGRIIYMTRLWNPANIKKAEEVERREKQNEFRINACRIIRKHFPDSITGLFPDDFAKEKANDVLLDFRKTRKKDYLTELRNADICIADDGLKDTPGFKIGEYVMFKKAVISTPIKTVIEDFKPDENYLSTTDRNDYQSLPDLINHLIQNKSYQEMKRNNEIWYNRYLRPDAYIENILARIDE